MKTLFMFLLAGTMLTFPQTSETPSDGSKLRQYYSGKFGFYQPGAGLNNGLLLGIDGITEFVRYNIGVSGSIDLYQKQTFDFFNDPKPQVQQQGIVVLPVHANIGYKLIEVPDADLRIFLSAGAGYYFYFYSAEYKETSGGGILNSGSLSTTTANTNGGNLFGTTSLRVLFGKVFVEPRFYFARPEHDAVGRYGYTVNPSGFAITIGFQQ